MHLLDTDTLTQLHAGHVRVREHLQALTDPDVGTTIVTRSEMLAVEPMFSLKRLLAQKWCEHNIFFNELKRH